MNYHHVIENMNWDINFFRQLYKDTVTDEWINAAGKEALKMSDANPIQVSDHAYLQSIRDQLPKLLDHVKLIKVDAGSIPPHKDRWRTAAINIPAFNNSTESVTRFYENTTDEEFVSSATFGFIGAASPVHANVYSNEWIQYVSGGEVTETFCITDKPVLIAAAEAHDVVNNSGAPRWIFSWTYQADYETALAEVTSV